MRQNNYFKYLENLFCKVTSDGRLTIIENISHLNNIHAMRAARDAVEPRQSKAEKIQQLIEELEGFHLFDIAIKNKSLLKRIDLVFEETVDKRSISFDVFTLLGITKQDIPAQIEEIQNFWSEVKSLMLPHLDNYPMLRIFNCRDQHQKTYFELNLCICKEDVAEQYSQEQINYIQNLAKNSPTLMEMFTRAALNLNKMGPHCTAMVRYSDILNDSELRAQFTKETKEKYKTLNPEVVQALIDNQINR